MKDRARSCEGGPQEGRVLHGSGGGAKGKTEEQYFQRIPRISSKPCSMLLSWVQVCCVLVVANIFESPSIRITSSRLPKALSSGYRPPKKIEEHRRDDPRGEMTPKDTVLSHKVTTWFENGCVSLTRSAICAVIAGRGPNTLPNPSQLPSSCPSRHHGL
jgi:hypothetical protein